MCYLLIASGHGENGEKETKEQGSQVRKEMKLLL